jgi:hypothetical protein
MSLFSIDNVIALLTFSCMCKWNTWIWCYLLTSNLNMPHHCQAVLWSPILYSMVSRYYQWLEQYITLTVWDIGLLSCRQSCGENLYRSYQKCLYHSIFYFVMAAIYNRSLSNLRTIQDITQQKLHAQDTTTLHPNVFWTGIHWLLFTAANRLNSTCVTTAKFIAVVLDKHHGAYIFRMEVIFPVSLPPRHRQKLLL